MLKAWKDGNMVNYEIVRGLTMGGGLDITRGLNTRRLPKSFSEERRRIMQRRDMRRRQHGARKAVHQITPTNY